MKQKHIVLRLTDIYGGDGFERPHTVEEVNLEESKTTITVRKDLGVPVERERERKQVTEKEVAVRTFKRDDDGTPMYRLGGTHGKLWGAMKEAAESMYDTGEIDLSLTAIKERFMPVVQIRPQWVRLETPDDTDIELDVLPQMLNTQGSSMVEHYFDVIPEATAEVDIRYPEPYEPVVEQCLERMETMSFGNKRRGTLEVTDERPAGSASSGTAASAATDD